MKPLNLKKIYLGLLSISGSILILGILWTILAFNMKDKIESFLKETSLGDRVLSYEKIKIEHFFPMLTLKIRDFSLVENNVFSLKIPELYLSLFPLQPRTVKLSTNHADLNLIKPTLFFTFNSPELHINLTSPEEHSSFSSKTLDLTLNDHHLANLDDLNFSISSHSMIANNDQGQYTIPGFDIISSVKTLILDHPIDGFEANFQNISLVAFIMEKISFKDPSLKSLKEILGEWSARGGACDISKASFSSGNLSINLEGTVALDQTLNPEGSFTLHIKGISDFLSQLAKTQTYSNQDQLFLQLSLGFLSGSKGELTLPLTLMDQTIRLGNFVQIKLPSLNW